MISLIVPIRIGVNSFIWFHFDGMKFGEWGANVVGTEGMLFGEIYL